MERVPIRELITQLEQEMLRVGYKEGTLGYYRDNWKRIIAHFDDIGEQYYSETIAMSYVDSKCDFFAKEEAGLLSQSNIYLFRIVRMIGDFQQHGTVLRRYMRSLSKVNAPRHIALLARFGEHCHLSDYAISTQRSYRRIAENFLSFVEAHGLSIQNLNTENLNAFVKTLMGYSYKMVEFMICGTRAFLRFLHQENVLSEDLSGSLPMMQVRKQTRIPSVWKKDDLQKLLDAIDRGNPSGKRDYAIILLVARLGLRCIDVKQLTFAHFNWNDSYLEFTQSKTKRPVRLPLLPDVGWAVIDYLQNGRPASDSPYVFLRHLAPIVAFSDEDRLRQIIVKHMRAAKLPLSNKKRIGMHSLRHTLATTLMEQHIPIQEIADILGHQSTESTPVYLKSSLNLLRECALSPEVE
jgi:site-specific recombinase XerD